MFYTDHKERVIINVGHILGAKTIMSFQCGAVSDETVERKGLLNASRPFVCSREGVQGSSGEL
jgi:hypothetical protein